MKSTEFIVEGHIRDIAKKYNLPTNLAKLAISVITDCQPYLHENNNPISTPLYRGVNTSGLFKQKGKIIKKNVRLDDRIPTDSGTDLHNELNKAFNDAFGEPFRNAMFCSGATTIVEYYGDVYVVFPIGNFKYLWSNDVTDVFQAYDDFNTGTTVDFVEKLVHCNYRTNNLQAGIKSNNEIMIRCKNYYGIKYEYLNTKTYWIQALQECIKNEK